MACSYGIEQPCSECRMCEQTKEINTDKEKQEFNQNKCDKTYHASCLADTNCKDNCDMKCKYENKAEEQEQMSIQEAVTNLKNLFSAHELTLPNTDSLETLQVILQAIEESACDLNPLRHRDR